MKKFFRVALVLVLLAVLFRGQLYRLLVSYQVATYRPITLVPDAELQALSDSLQRESDNLEGFVFNVQQFAGRQLSFRANNSGRSTAAILAGGEANCVGYAQVVTDLIKRNIKEYPRHEVKQGIATLSLLGFDLHALFSSPSFRDHDVVEILQEGETLLVLDPSLWDYTAIKEVSIQ